MFTFLDRFFERFRSDTAEDQMIDHFQLESLLRNQVPFLLLDLRIKETAPLSKEVSEFLRLSKRVPWSKLETYLSENKIDSQSPLVFICSAGRDSRRMARVLRKKSWTNVYVLAGGLERLTADLKPPLK